MAIIDQAFQNTLNLPYQRKTREFIDWIKPRFPAGFARFSYIPLTSH